MVIKTKQKKLTRREVDFAIKKFKQKLKSEKIPVKDIFLFGSYAKGRPHADSDIDVAITISADVKKDVRKKIKTVSWLAKQINVKMETHVLSVEDFNNRFLSLSAEIRKHGVKV